jgi:TFIIF-interacting CTD phosphatase-like protein
MISAEEANKLSLASQEKYEMKMAKHLVRDMNQMHSEEKNII